MHQGAFLTIWGNLPAARSDRVDNSAWFDGAAGGEGDDALTRRRVEYNGHEERTLLELVLQLHGEFRRKNPPARIPETTFPEPYLLIETEDTIIDDMLELLNKLGLTGQSGSKADGPPAEGDVVL